MQEIQFYNLMMLVFIFIYFMNKQYEFSFSNISIGRISTLEFPNILLFADEKTEDATPKKIRDARKKGQVSKSTELNSAITLIVGIMVILFFGNLISDEFIRLIRIIFREIPNVNLDITSSLKLVEIAIMSIIKISSIMVIPILGAAIVANLFQVGFLFTTESLKVDFNKLNPISGFKKIFSKRAIFELVKNLAKLAAITLIVFNFFKSRSREFLSLNNIEIMSTVIYLKELVGNLAFQLILFSIIIAVADIYFQRYSYKKELKMSKQEIKEEYKQTEGDPLIKAQRKQRQRQLVFNRMISEVPKATVVITNPTHFAVALKYDPDGEDVPVVVAKGMNYIAQKIKAIAKENEVPIIENKLLARTLYKKVDVFERIPVDLYSAVAEILAAIYRIKPNRR